MKMINLLILSATCCLKSFHALGQGSYESGDLSNLADLPLTHSGRIKSQYRRFSSSTELWLEVQLVNLAFLFSMFLLVFFSSPCSSISILLCFSKTISVKVIDDEEYEKNKTFFLEIGEPRLVEMSEKKGGEAAPGLSPTASAGLCRPWMPALFRCDSQHTHPSTYVTGHRPHPGATVGPACSSISQFQPFCTLQGWEMNVQCSQSGLHSGKDGAVCHAKMKPAFWFLF